MRVLHVVSTGARRGAEIFASDLISALNDSGLSQRVAVLRASHDPDVAYDSEVVALPSDGWRAPGLRMNLTTLRSLRRLIRSWQPHIAQAHGGEAFKYSLFAAHGLQTGVVYRRIGAAPEWITHGLKKRAHAQLMRSADRVIAVAEAVSRETTNVFKVPPDRVLTIPNGVSLERARPSKDRQTMRRHLGIASDAIVMLSLGSLTWEKDPLTHIDVARHILQQRADAVHLVVGDGPQRASVQIAAQQDDLKGRVLVLGGRSDVADLLGASDVLLFASRDGGMEGMPAGTIEAGIAGVPVAGYAVAGVPEVVVNGVTGLLVSPGDKASLGAALFQLVGDRRGRSVMGEAARKRCIATFDIRIIAPRYLHVYEELLSEIGGRGSTTPLATLTASRMR